MRHLIITLFAVLSALAASAQPMMGPPPGMGGGPSEADKAARKARMYERLKAELNLTQEQAEKFAPVYQQYQRDIAQVRKDLKTYLDSYKDQEIDDKAAYNMLKAQLDNELDVVKIKREYIKIFKDYLNPEQLSKIFMAEKKSARGGRPNGQPGSIPPPPGDMNGGNPPAAMPIQ